MRNPSVISMAAVCVVAGSVAWLFTQAAAPTAGREDEAVARSRLDRRLRQNHARAEEILAALRRRIWNPARDGKLRTVALVISVKQNDKTGKYRARFDSSKALDSQITMETLEEEADIHPGSFRQAKQWADVALLGAYQEVMNPLPADRMALGTTTDGRSVITTSEFAFAPQTSYSFDARGLVGARGEILRGTSTRIMRYLWQDWETGAVLKGWTEELDKVRGVAEASFEYGRDRGFPTLRRAVLRERTKTSGPSGDRFEASFEWTEIVKQ